MEESQSILLNSSINKKSINENSSLNVELSGNKRLLPEDAINGTIDAYDVYISERERSNKFRLIFNINPYCTNVLFNPFTEIIKNEGSKEVLCLNYSPQKLDNTIGKGNTFEWTQYDAIRDTQLSNKNCGFDYNCGIDIFNNHILRSKTLKTVNYDSNNSNMSIGTLKRIYGDNYKCNKVNELGATITWDEIGVTRICNECTESSGHRHSYFVEKDFNTIDDYLRDNNGVIISEHFNVKNDNSTNNSRSFTPMVLPLHLYQDYDVYSFKECVSEKLTDDNGWYGLNNPSNLDSLFEYNNEYRSMDINKTINNKLYCDFIDMYPGRDLYSFVPKYNKFKKRLEKNWQYFITYPSRIVTRNGENSIGSGDNFPFFRYDSENPYSRNISLKAYMIDEGTVNDYGEYVLTVYSVCQHGLVVGDTVNIYKSDELFYNSVEVTNIVSKYIFQVIKNTGNMSERWIEFKRRYTGGISESLVGDDRITEDGSETPSQQVLFNGVFKYGDNYYPICESNRCNIDKNAQDIHFSRVVNGVECKYYVRKFSRLPNFKFKDEEVNDYTLYGKKVGEGEETLIQRFSRPGNENTLDKKKKPINFESHISKLGFANTSYNDDSVEIVFTDDIDTSYLRDNLDRPLSDIYLTIVKNNTGYKKWYGIGNAIDLINNEIEYSHCFGKVNSSFILSDYFREFYKADAANSHLFDARDLTVGGHNGLFQRGTSDDEIKFDEDYEYYGDICCYSPIDCDEQIIQNAMFRFNTAQRELNSYQSVASLEYFNFGVVYHDEIRDTENTLTSSNAHDGDPYEAFLNGSNNSKSADEISDSDNNLYHTTKEKYNNMLSFVEGYYYQPHYRVPVKTVSKSLSFDESIKYEITSIEKDEEKSVFVIKTFTDNNFLKNEKANLYMRSKNEYFNIVVCDLLTPYAFECIITDEYGNDLNGNVNFSDINDFIITKKHNSVPSYAKLILDGSCRYCWRDIISNNIEQDEVVYPFTNGAFYITKQINFFLRRQGEYIYSNSTFYPGYNYTPKREIITDYPNFNFIDDINYEPKEIREC